ncbi:hypothetical protein G5B40_07790 [Pikeienuella piscinae]|uniref:Uncharacterized protein n=1 Tax=Pikeienuella piscinae TaxID=2748098 RepID=A0A7L5BYP7_9RHOB|nr:hypothetical protein [Pikeienuella piscinae]QIE55366.1 hypothetical protein G5B40_07790 [Pikeienuella piscinae]
MTAPTRRVPAAIAYLLPVSNTAAGVYDARAVAASSWSWRRGYESYMRAGNATASARPDTPARRRASHPHAYLIGARRALVPAQRIREVSPILAPLGRPGDDAAFWTQALPA